MPELVLAKPKDLFSYFSSQEFHKKLLAAIPNQLKPERMVQLALTMIKGSPNLMRCTPVSLLASVFECAQLGLELDRVLGHAYLVPYKDQCTLIIGYRGFCHLMYQSGSIVSVTAEIVRKKDKFTRTLGTSRGLFHEPAPIPKDDHYDQWVGAYAVVKFLHGSTEFEYMEASQIEKHRARSQSWRAFKERDKDSPWDTDAADMWCKTPTRRLAKRMPLSTTDKRELLLRAVMLDEYREKPGLLRPTEHGFEVNDMPLLEEEAIAPTEDLSGKLQESIDIANAKKDRPGREKKKPPKERATWESTHCPHCGVSMADLDPKTSGAMHLTGRCKEVKVKIDTVKDRATGETLTRATRIDDPLITSKQQTELFHVASQSGWQIPEEFNGMLLKRFSLKSVQQVRTSQFAEILAIARGDK